jgi:two-component system KDP operon response regulator KdpE
VPGLHDGDDGEHRAQDPRCRRRSRHPDSHQGDSCPGRRSGDPGALLREAGTLGEARRILAGEPIDLLLLDVHLPDGLGLDLAAELRRRPGDRPAIVALTASVLPTDQQAALNAGCDAFLAKPYPATALVSICSELATQRARTQAARTVEPR